MNVTLIISKERSLKGKETKKLIEIKDRALSVLEAIRKIEDFFDYKISNSEIIVSLERLIINKGGTLTATWDGYIVG